MSGFEPDHYWIYDPVRPTTIAKTTPKCWHCGAHLSLYNRDDTCWPCQKEGVAAKRSQAPATSTHRVQRHRARIKEASCPPTAPSTASS